VSAPIAFGPILCDEPAPATDDATYGCGAGDDPADYAVIAPILASVSRSEGSELLFQVADSLDELGP